MVQCEVPPDRMRSPHQRRTGARHSRRIVIDHRVGNEGVPLPVDCREAIGAFRCQRDRRPETGECEAVCRPAPVHALRDDPRGAGIAVPCCRAKRAFQSFERIDSGNSLDYADEHRPPGRARPRAGLDEDGGKSVGSAHRGYFSPQ